jgi:hypothetical protein
MSVPEFQSKRVRKNTQSGLSSTRYKYLSLDEAEPDLGDPVIGPSSTGAKPYPVGADAFILASFGGTDRGPSRYWVPPSSLTGLGLGLVPGAMTIRDEGLLVGAANSFTVLNFVGAGVTVDYIGAASSQQTGIATIRVDAAGAGELGQFQIKAADTFLDAAPEFFYYADTGNVGFGTTVAREKFDVSGVGTEGKIRANAFIGNPESISGSTTLRPGDDEQTFSKLGKLRAGYINVNTISSPDATGLNTSLIDTLTNTRFNSDFINSGVTTTISLQSTVFETSEANITGIATIYSQEGTFANVGLATITDIKSTNQVFSGITTSFESDINFATIGYTTVTYANIGVATIQYAHAVDANIGLATIGTADITIQDVDYSYIGLSTLGITTVTQAYIGVATIANLDARNVTISGTSGNISIGNTLNVAGIAATDITVSNRLGIKTDPDYELDVNGDVQISGLIYASNGRGVTGEVLTSQGSNPAVFAPASNVTVGAANSVAINDVNTDQLFNVAFTDAVNDTGFVQVDDGNLVYNPNSNRLGVGNTIPQFNVDINGDINFTGGLYENGQTYVASNWTKDDDENIYKVDKNVGIGTTVVSAQLTVNGRSEFTGDIIVDENHKIGIGSTTPRSELDLVGDARLAGYAHFEGSVTENVSGQFATEFIPSSGTLTIDCSSSTVVVGFLTATVATWAFTGVNTEDGKATTITLIVDSSSLITYGEQCSINGVSVSGGVRWPGGIAPFPTNNEDILSFAVLKDLSGSIRVYGTSSLNFS